jgi:hypothetical protein
MAKKELAEAKQQQPIKTPQSLIHIKHRISILQYKYWILLLRELREQIDAQVAPDENGFRSVQMQKLGEALGYVPNKAELFKDLLALKNETIAFNVLGKDGQEEKYGAGFISEWKVTSQRVSFKFPSFLENVVRGLQEPTAIFQLLNWEIFNHFSGKYEAVIYKLCKDYVGVGQTPYMTVKEFREYMGLRESEYMAFKDLSRNVIVNPSARVNDSDVSDIFVEPEFEKEKRVVVGLRFKVKRKRQTSIPFPEFEPNPAFRFAKAHIEPAAQKEYLGLRTPDEIEQCIERANVYGEKQERAGETVNYGGLYRKSISEGWHVQHLEQKKKKTEAAVKKAKATETESLAAQEKKAKLQREREEMDSFLATFDALPEEKKKSIRAEFRATLTEGIVAKHFDKDGERSMMHRAKFMKFAIERM